MARGIPLNRFFAATAVAVVLAFPGTALAHGDVRDSSPAAGTRVTKPPREVVVLLAEAPSEGSSLVVTDGCESEVSGGVDIRRDSLQTPTEGGQPGRWLVSVRSISAVDDHAIEEAFTFTVEGKKDCSAGEDDDIEPDDDTDISPDTSSRAPIDNPDDEGTSFPVVPFALGAVAVIAIALAVRQPWNKP